jgi:hypothetical protein
VGLGSADVSPVIPHAKARVVETVPGGGNRYFGVGTVADPQPVDRVRITYVAPTGALELSRISLYDAASGRSHPLSVFHHLLAVDPRWQPRFRSGSVLVLENRRVLPRVWLTSATERLAAPAVLGAVESGLLPDGRAFDPAAVALVEDGPQLGAGSADPDAQAAIVEYTPTRIVLQSHAGAPAFLVLSEIFFPGWQASVDGAPTPIWRTDYVLRGLAVPAGTHRIELVYAPRSVRIGAAISALAFSALAAVAVAQRRRARRAGEGGA